MQQTAHYAPGKHPDMPAPSSTVGLRGWLTQNLFSTPLNIGLTAISLYLIHVAIPPVADWAFIDASWRGETREDCDRVGACWVYIRVWFKQLMYGRYPVEQLWRINTAYVVLILAAIPLFMPRFRYKHWVGLFLLIVYPIFAYVMFYGDTAGLALIETPLWGGLFLTLVIAVTGIVASLPIGIVLALGRRSNMPVVRAICVAFIELWRGVPLITVLFMSSVMFPLFMPEGVNFDKLLRALVGVMLFSAAYMAEVVRGGLQAIPKG